MSSFSPAQTVTRFALLAFGPVALIALVLGAHSLETAGVAVVAAWLWNPWTLSGPAALLAAGRSDLGEGVMATLTAPLRLLADRQWSAYAALAWIGWFAVLVASWPGLQSAVDLFA